MNQDPGSQRAPKAAFQAPLHGTQSLVGVAAQVWMRPRLLALELLWRWCAAVPLLCLAAWSGARALRGVPFDRAALERMTALRPAEAASTLARQFSVTRPARLPVARGLAPLALVVWAVASVLGKIAIWRRLDPTLRPRVAAVGWLGLGRSLFFVLTLGVWLAGLWAAGRYAITAPAAAGAEPNLVLYVGLAVALTSALFVLWSVTVWVVDAATLFALCDGSGVGLSLRQALRAGALRPKLIEINMVMGIVKVALLVLAMVFSASPLPFVTVETQSFLAAWWSLVAVLYLVASDLFHVVRRAASLAFFRALMPPAADTPPVPERAS